MSTKEELSQVRTAPQDPRFPNQNVTKWCWHSYVDNARCEKNGEESERCAAAKKAMKAVCPLEWIEKWNDQRDEGTFPVRDINNE